MKKLANKKLVDKGGKNLSTFQKKIFEAATCHMAMWQKSALFATLHESFGVRSNRAFFLPNLPYLIKTFALRIKHDFESND